MANIKTVKVVVKHVPDYSASREKNDLGFLTFDLQVCDTPKVITTECFMDLDNLSLLWFS